MNYYNEIDPYCAAWLQNLMDAGHIAPGVIDTRSIEDVRPDELAGYTQCHFFAGLGGWAYALDLAGWPRDRPVWTGSCPCQPFSAAGKGAGFADERHLWPAWQHLIAQCRPPGIFGEQVASKDADPWIDLVHADLEGMGYAFGCVPFPSAGVGAPHIRDRTYWVADLYSEGLPQRIGDGRVQREAMGAPTRQAANGRDDADRLAHASREGSSQQRGRRIESTRSSALGVPGGLADANGWNASAEREQRSGEQRQQPQDGGVVRLAEPHGERAGIDSEALHARESELGGHSGHGGPGPTNGHWGDADWLCCTDGKWRPVEPGTFPLAHGVSGRVGRLRAYGNAINAEAAKAFIEGYCEARNIESLRKVA